MARRLRGEARQPKGTVARGSRERPPPKPGRLFHSPGTGNPADVHERERMVHELIARGVPRRVMREQVAQHFGVAESTVAATVAKCVREYDDDLRTHVREEKALQKYRLERDLMRLRDLAIRYEDTGSPVYSPATAARYWSLVHRYEQIWADVVGTREPVRMAVEADVRVRESLIAVVSSMSESELNGAAERALAARDAEGEPRH